MRARLLINDVKSSANPSRMEAKPSTTLTVRKTPNAVVPAKMTTRQQPERGRIRRCVSKTGCQWSPVSAGGRQIILHAPAISVEGRASNQSALRRVFPEARPAASRFLISASQAQLR
jgi:hypothetical protein